MKKENLRLQDLEYAYKVIRSLFLDGNTEELVHGHTAELQCVLLTLDHYIWQEKKEEINDKKDYDRPAQACLDGSHYPLSG